MTKKRPRGFTLIEILIAITLFSITIVVAVDVIVAYTKLQNRGVIQQTLGSDARFVMESIARQMRLGTIDYDYYADPPDESGEIYLTAGPINKLAIKDNANNVTLYRLNTGTDKVEVSNDIYDIGGGTWTSITPDDIEISRLDFYISPAVDPFALQDPVPAADSKYKSDEQPRVTIVMSSISNKTNPPVEKHLQTTISSRFYVR
ncbi:MAG: prepilin-type N-terminal cleavage/methylation domain-containing protein [Patescibacteria group bacterium]